MRFAYGLVGLVTMTSLQISNGLCSNSIAGVESQDVCCEAQCGTCGGEFCDGRPGGADACCITTITDVGTTCSTTKRAPCIIDVIDGTCSNDLAGIESDNVCCEGQCGSCGGNGCGLRPGGVTGCCVNAIRDSGTMCNTTSEAPCVLDGVCYDGTPGVQDGNICCEAQCGTCGGPGCSQRSGYLDGCCSDAITETGKLCSTTAKAPCIIDGLCRNGVPGVEDGNVCCELQCGTCGGELCDGRPGGVAGCCVGNIKDSGTMCTTTSEAPCVIDIIDGICSNGLPGNESQNVCCEDQCGSCGGRDCHLRPGGAPGCCVTTIRDSGTMCNTTSEAPCVLDGICYDGTPGVQVGNICCEAQCGTCGGPGCSQRSGSLDGCCRVPITDSGKLCSTTSEAPCIIDGLCRNGVPGVEADNICCEAQCGTCGGEFCDGRPGGADACCVAAITDVGITCNTTFKAPCVIDG